MSVTRVQETLLTSAFSVVRSSGLLSTSAGSRIFQSAYFAYKYLLEDNLHGLLHAHPHLVKDGDILDIGANIGYTVVVLANASKQSQTVHAFEPDPHNFELLGRIARKKKFAGRIVPNQCAVGAETGTAELWFNERHHADHRIITDKFRSTEPRIEGTTVPLLSVDDYLKDNPERVCFSKIDVQGYEGPVCQGMTNTLNRNPAMSVFLEYSPSGMRTLGFDPGSLLSFFAARDFHCYVVSSGGKLSKDLPKELEHDGYADLLFSRQPLQ